MKYQNTFDFAQSLDEKDKLKHFRNQFYFPKDSNGRSKLYFCGNSLGLQPKNAKYYVAKVLEDWQNFGVDGHTNAEHPWMPYHEFLSESMAKIVGAKESEVIIMNTLSVNLHLMMVSFYQPTPKRRKILIEADAFPSDLYGVQSQLKFHGFDAQEDLVLWKPDKNKQYNLSDFDALLEQHKDEIALVLIGNTNYYTGQFFDMRHITEKCHKKEITVGFDLAHGVGNIQPNLHELGVDFAVWCTYKYLNSGPGSLGGCFVHEKHHKTKDIPRFEGWWGHDKDTRFNMRQAFSPIESAEAWQLSNPPILSMAAIRASLDVFEQAGFENILSKSLFNKLTDAGVVADWREPQVIRIAPVPLYNSYQDVFNFIQLLKQIRNAG